MDKKDLEQIRQVVKEEVRHVVKEEIFQGFTQVWEGNLEPAFNSVHNDIAKLQGQISQLPTKSYLDDKIANLKGDFTTKLRKQDEKINRIS